MGLFRQQGGIRRMISNVQSTVWAYVPLQRRCFSTGLDARLLSRAASLDFVIALRAVAAASAAAINHTPLEA